MNIDIQQAVMQLVILVFSISLHEFGHAIAAYKLGDPGPKNDKRLTLMPDRHFDPLGFIMLVITIFSGFGFAWGKPVLVNERCFRNPRRDMLITTAAGPAMNLLLALVFGIIFRIGLETKAITFAELNASMIWTFVHWCILLNLGMMFFNLIPLVPLDGSKILMAFMPPKAAYQYESFMSKYSIILFILLIATGATRFIIFPAVYFAYKLIVGVV